MIAIKPPLATLQDALPTRTSGYPDSAEFRPDFAKGWRRNVRISLVPSERLEARKPEPSSSAEAPSRLFQKALVDAMPQLRRYALRLCSDPNFADDLVQETMLNAWLARHRFQAGTNLKAWCATILRNVFFSHKRRSWRMLPLADEVMDSLPATTFGESDALDLLALRNVIGLLAAEQREALLLVAVGGLSYNDAAEVCGCAPGTIKSRVSRARLRASVLLEANKAGFSSDPDLSAQGAMDDLFHQVADILVPPAAVRISRYKPILTAAFTGC